MPLETSKSALGLVSGKGVTTWKLKMATCEGMWKRQAAGDQERKAKEKSRKANSTKGQQNSSTKDRTTAGQKAGESKQERKAKQCPIHMLPVQEPDLSDADPVKGCEREI